MIDGDSWRSGCVHIFYPRIFLTRLVSCSTPSNIEGILSLSSTSPLKTRDGTGIVHIAPTFGADDDKVAKQNGIAPLFMIDKKGDTRLIIDLTGKYFNISDLDDNFVKTNVNLPSYQQWAGRFVKNAYDQHLSDTDVTLDVDICIELKQRGQVFKIEKHTHNYPHCWRTDKPVLYYPLDSWFIRTTAVKDEMIALNDTINWKPQSTGSGCFGKWFENLQLSF